MTTRKEGLGRVDARKARGQQGEELVAKVLSTSGWQILDRNWRNGRLGELDIVAVAPDGPLVFIEVKTRSTSGADCFGFREQGFDAVHRNKQRKIVTTAMAYRLKNEVMNRQFRFDVIVVKLPSQTTLGKTDEPEVIHVANAF